MASHPDEELIERLLSMLDLNDASTRFTVKDSLIRIGRAVTGQLALRLSVPSGPSPESALEVAMSLRDPRLLPAALALCHDDVPRLRAIAAGLAGAIGGVLALETLVGLLGDDSPEVRCAATRALGKAGHWPAAPVIADLLRDSSWDVRRQASVALWSFGSPGLLFLRRALSSDDPFAADAARHILDLPDSALRTL